MFNRVRNNGMFSEEEYKGKTIEEIKTAATEEKKFGAAKLFIAKHSKIISLAIFVAFFNQASGINFILYYAPRILEKAGFASQQSLLSSISIGLMNLIFTFLLRNIHY